MKVSVHKKFQIVSYFEFLKLIYRYYVYLMFRILWKMENYEAFVGFDLCKIPLSSVAQKIMSAMRSGDLVESKNWRESENSE